MNGLDKTHMRVVRWGAMWRDKDTRHIMFENCLPVVFLTRRKAQAWIDEK